MARSAVVLVAAALAAPACAAPGDPPALEKARPPWAPLSGGTTVELLGSRFDPYENRVFVGGREATIVRTLDDQHLRIVVPPGDHAGDAELVILTRDQSTLETGAFRYSEPPRIESTAPARVLLSALPATISVRGSGFLDEDAGPPLVLVAGQPIADVQVRDDSLLVFPAPPGVAFTRPEIEIVNRRGRATGRGPRYAISDLPGVILYASNGESDTFAWFYEPTSQTLTTIPRAGATRPCLYAAMTAANGDHVASAYCLDFPYGYTRVDLAAQSVVDVVPAPLYYAMARHQDRNYGIELGSRRFGTFGDDGTGFSPIGPIQTGFQYGLASARGALYLAARDAAQVPSISTIDPETGARGPAMPLSSFTDIYDMTALDGVLYAVTSDSRLVTIEPDTGEVTPLVTFGGQSFAMDVLR